MFEHKNFARPYIHECAAYNAGKSIEDLKLKLETPTLIKLSSNENPLGASSKAVEAARKSLLEIQYYPGDSAPDLRIKISKIWNTDKDNVIIGNGSLQLLELLFKTFLNEGEEVIIADPTFRVYSELIKSSGGKIKKVALNENMHDLSEMKNAVDEKTKLIIICNPNNPTGTYVSHHEIHSFLESLPRHVMVILDEAYMEYVNCPEDQKRLPLDIERPWEETVKRSLDFIESGYPVIVLKTFSKIYGLAGLRVGYALGNKTLIGLMEKARIPHTVNTPAIKAALSAIDDTEFIKLSRMLVWEQKELIYKDFKELGLYYIPTQANFVMVKVESDDKIFSKMLMNEGIIVYPGSFTGMPRFLRITIGTNSQRKILKKKLAKVIRDIHSIC